MVAQPHSHVEPAFAIKIDPDSRLVDIALHGLWSLEVCARFDHRLRAMLPLLPLAGCRIGSQVTLFDMTDFPVQQQATLMALAAMAADPSIGSRRIAIVTRSALVRQQAHRVAPTYCVFEQRKAAIDWLLQDDPARQMAAA